ncbi:hypothetical protein PUMCH_004595 [Australozyma saopauloensis]|uniref:t-SNARE coiled-coil homology domain-containing protein n=1 Tax=Australozyma saopauloensis TaxID=291208 RepID=A0AAX4HF27_9ASCO|nr:hypothetical protein PUMCH_004595 [[Candida] saopauloensis]
MSNPYARQNNANQGDSYEMHTYKYDDGNDFVAFMNEIQDINNQLDEYARLVELVSRKQRLHLHDLDFNEEQADYESRQIDLLILEASSLQSLLKNRIKNAQQLAAQLRNPQQADQAESTRKRFLELIQTFRLAESNNREQTKIHAERQFKIVKPDATPEELRAVVEDGSGAQQIFQQAMMQSNRRGEARTVLNEVQVRHRELLKLEKTMAELTQLFHDMEELVIEQDQPIQQIEEQINTAQYDIEQGVGHTQKAVVSAKKARKKKIWCFFICVLILVILGLILGLYFGLRK